MPFGKKTVRVLHVLDHSIPLHSGYTFRTRAILLQQRRFGWETEQITSGKQGMVEAAEETVEGLRFYRTRPPHGLWQRLPVIGQWRFVSDLRRRLGDIIKETWPDIVHAHSPVLTAVAALPVARQHGLPLVYEVRAFWEDAAVDHGTTRQGSLRYRATRALETRMLRRADAVTCICEGLRREIVGRGIGADKVTVIPNAVDIDAFGFGRAPDLDLKQSLGLDSEVVLGFIGSFYAYEGLDLLLDALPLLRAQGVAAKLLLVGGGPQAEALKARVKRQGLSEWVRFVGRVPHDVVQRYYDLVDIFVYPRRSMRLTELVTPLKPLEAMAQGKLVIASSVGGHVELIRPGLTGELFPPGDVQALTTTIVKLVADRSDWPRRQHNGRRFVAEERNWTVAVGRYRGVYDAVSHAALHSQRT